MDGQKFILVVENVKVNYGFVLWIEMRGIKCTFMWFSFIPRRERNIKSREMKISSFLTLCWCLNDILLGRWRRFSEMTVNFSCLMTMMVLLLTFLYLISSPLFVFLFTTVLSMFACFNLLWLFMDIYRMKKLFSSALLRLLECFFLSREFLNWGWWREFQKHTGDDRCQLSKESLYEGMFALKIDGLLTLMRKLIVLNFFEV